MSNFVYVTSRYDKEIDYRATIDLMDDDLREEIHSDLSPCTEQEFFDEYCKRDPDWIFNQPNPQY